MSWRDQSSAPQSQLEESEKEFLKTLKKLRDISKLEAKIADGEKLAENQKTKLNSKEDLTKELARWAKRIPPRSDMIEKNKDVDQYLSADVLQSVGKSRKATVRWLENEIRQDPIKKAAPEFMKRHDRSITAVCYDAIHERIYTASKDKFVLEWKVCMQDSWQQLSAVRTLAGHDGSVSCVDVTQEGVVSGGADGRLCIFARSAEKISKPVKTVEIGGVVKCIHHQPSGIVVAGDKIGATKAYIAVVDHNLREVWRQTDFQSKTNAVVWGPVGAVAKVVTAHEDGRLSVWHGGTGERMTSILRHQGPIWSLSCRGDFVVSASQDKTAKVTDFSSRELPEVRRVETNRPLRTCIFDGSDTLVYAGGREPREVTTSNLLEDEFQIFTERRGESAKTQNAHFGPVHQVLFSSTGQDPQSFFSISEDGCLKFWSISGSILGDDMLY